MASDIKIGDKDLVLRGGESVVAKIEEVIEEGLFCPLTENGMLFVDGVLASCYASTKDYGIGHLTFSGHQVCV